MALDQLDEIINLIRSASDSATAKSKLQELHGLTDIQSDAILQMQLRRLTALEADKIRLEHEDLVRKITDLKDREIGNHSGTLMRRKPLLIPAFGGILKWSD